MKKLNLKLYKMGSENDNITRLIANYNEGKTEISPRDLEGYFKTRAAIYPMSTNAELIKDTEPNTYHISEDGGKTFTMSLEWAETWELNDNDDLYLVLTPENETEK